MPFLPLVPFLPFLPSSLGAFLPLVPFLLLVLTLPFDVFLPTDAFGPSDWAFARPPESVTVRRPSFVRVRRVRADCALQSNAAHTELECIEPPRLREVAAKTICFNRAAYTYAGRERDVPLKLRFR